MDVFWSSSEQKYFSIFQEAFYMMRTIVTLWSEIKVMVEKFLVVMKTTRNHFLVGHSHFLVVEDTWTRRFSYPNNSFSLLLEYPSLDELLLG